METFGTVPKLPFGNGRIYHQGEGIVSDQLEQVKELALSCGFSHAGPMDADTIRLRTEVRDACAVNKCHAYDTNWACPPGCGTLEECETRIRKYKKGVLLQTTGYLEDSMDSETMMQTGMAHGEHMNAFSDKIKQLYPGSMIIGAGACMRCKKCTYPDEPCRFPDKMSSSMEAYGMVVSDVCKDNNLPYYYGKDTLTYTGCVLLE
jgi:predicted metal-binding protein